MADAPPPATVAPAFLQAAEGLGLGFALLEGPTGLVLVANEALARLLHVAPGSLAGRDLFALFESADHEVLRQAAREAMTGATGPVEAARAHPNGDSAARLEITFHPTTVEGQSRLVLAARDIALRYRREQGLRLARDIALEIGSATSFDAALSTTLKRACEMTGWAVGQAWVPFGSRLECRHSYARVPGMERFAEDSHRRYFKVGEGLPGRVWASRQPAWLTAIEDDPHFPRGRVALECGLLGGFAVPVIARDQVVAVLEFFVREPDRHDEAFLALLTTVAAQLGQALEWKQAEASLRASEAQFRRFVETAQEGIWAFDASGRTTYVNQRLADMLLTTPPEMLGRSLLDFMDKRLHHEARRAFARRKQGLRETFETQLRRRDGSNVWVLISMTPPADEPVPTGALCMVVDITDRRRAEQQAMELAREQAARAEAEASRARSTLLAQASERLAQSESEGGKLEGVAALVLPDFADGFVVHLQEEPGRLRRAFARFVDPSLEAAFEPSLTVAARGVMDEALAAGRLVRHVEDPSLRSSAPTPGASMIVAPLRARGAALGALTFLRSTASAAFAATDEALALDLARRTALELENLRLFEQTRRSEEQLRVANARLRELDEIRSDFVNKAAHELGTPITPLKMQIELLQAGGHGDLTPKQAESLSVMQRNLERLQDLVRDLLDVVRLAKSGWQLEAVEVDLAREILATVQDYRFASERAQVRLEWDVKEPLRVRADPRRLSQLMSNLFSNALKFTPSGGAIRVEGRRDGPNVVVSVTDSGSGIRPEDLPRLFQPFGQVGEENKRGRGTGLGLYICRGIVEQHGGRIWAESAGEGRGARFCFSLPALETSAPGAVPK